MAQPIVDGIKQEKGHLINIIQLNLLSAAGREASRAFGIPVVPATLLFDSRGDIVLRRIGIPDKGMISEAIDTHVKSVSSSSSSLVSKE